MPIHKIHDSCLLLQLRDRILAIFHQLLCPKQKELPIKEHHLLSDLRLHKKRWLGLLNIFGSLFIRRTLAFYHILPLSIPPCFLWHQVQKRWDLNDLFLKASIYIFWDLNLCVSWKFWIIILLIKTLKLCLKLFTVLDDHNNPLPSNL